MPSFSENFGIVVAEALAAGLPVITTTTTPWESLSENKIGWWVDPNVSTISELISQSIVTTDSQRTEMGNRGASWIEDNFSWPSVGSRMMEFYRWLKFEDPSKPDFVNVEDDFFKEIN